MYYNSAIQLLKFIKMESLINDEQLMRKIRKQTSEDLELGYYDKAKK